MVTIPINFNQQDLSLLPGQSLLDAALDRQLPIANSCRSGVCQTCLVKVRSGNIPPEAQAGLSDNQIQQNLALACQLRPTETMAVSDVDASATFTATVVGHDQLNANVLRLRLQAQLTWFPGQYLTVWKQTGVGRPYSVASLPGEHFLEFHIKRHDRGEVSQWLHDEIHIGDTIQLSEARGNCFYTPTLKQKPLLLIGAGTGLAPLYGICRDALAQSHQTRIDLLVCNRYQQQTYLHDELHQLAQQHANFYFESILTEEEKTGFSHGDIVKLVQQQYPALQDWCIFICGAPQLVRQLQKQCFLRGASLSNIHTDPFISSPPPDTK